LMTISKNQNVKSDLRVLERLVEKEDYVHKNIGDTAVIMGLYNADDEEKKIMKSVAKGENPDEAIPDTPADSSFLEMLLSQHEEPVPDDMLEKMPTLFKNEIKYAKEAFSEIVEDDSKVKFPDFHDTNPSFTWESSDDFRLRTELMPREAIPKSGEFVLSSDRDVIQKAISDSRKKTKTGESSWPDIQLFWEQHPVMEWLSDRVLAKFGRHDAPVIISQHLKPNEYIYLFQGIMSNMKSQPLLVEWFGVVYDGDSKNDVIFLKDVIQKTGLDNDMLNPQSGSNNIEMMERNLESAVDEASEWMIEFNKDRGQGLLNRMKEDGKRFKVWYKKSHEELKRLETIEVNKYGKMRKHIREKIEHRFNEVELLKSYRDDWLNETMKAVKAPYLKLACVFSGK